LNTYQLAGAAALAFGALAVSAAHAETSRPMFARQPLPRQMGLAQTAPALPMFTFAWSGGSEVFVGNDPTTGAAVTIPVVIIPLKMTYGTTTEDPLKKDSTGKSTIDHTVASPIFQSGIDYVQGGTDVGNTQYIDAFQRASLWYGVSSNTGYHVLLGKPTIAKEVALTIPKADGGVSTQFGAHVVTG
jgi:hypothetical protein